MRKLTLQLEQLRVDSFSPDGAPPARGTVIGATGGVTCITCMAITGCAPDGANTCYNTCNSCNHPCGESGDCYSTRCVDM